MLMHTDPFGSFERSTDALLGSPRRPTVAPMDAYRDDDTFVLHLDLPGVSLDSIDLTVEQNVLTVRAERTPPAAEGAERVVDERTFGVFTRQLLLGDTLDADGLTADYVDGVVTIRIPVVKESKARKVEVSGSASQEIEA
jgi:HSP20 family protein